MSISITNSVSPSITTAYSEDASPLPPPLTAAGRSSPLITQERWAALDRYAQCSIAKEMATSGPEARKYREGMCALSSFKIAFALMALYGGRITDCGNCELVIDGKKIRLSMVERFFGYHYFLALKVGNDAWDSDQTKYGDMQGTWLVDATWKQFFYLFDHVETMRYSLQRQSYPEHPYNVHLSTEHPNTMVGKSGEYLRLCEQLEKCFNSAKKPNTNFYERHPGFSRVEWRERQWALYGNGKPSFSEKHRDSSYVITEYLKIVARHLADPEGQFERLMREQECSLREDWLKRRVEWLTHGWDELQGELGVSLGSIEECAKRALGMDAIQSAAPELSEDLIKEIIRYVAG